LSLILCLCKLSYSPFGLFDLPLILPVILSAYIPVLQSLVHSFLLRLQFFNFYLCFLCGIAHDFKFLRRKHSIFGVKLKSAVYLLKLRAKLLGSIVYILQRLVERRIVGTYHRRKTEFFCHIPSEIIKGQPPNWLTVLSRRAPLLVFMFPLVCKQHYRAHARIFCIAHPLYQ